MEKIIQMFQTTNQEIKAFNFELGAPTRGSIYVQGTILGELAIANFIQQKKPILAGHQISYWCVLRRKFSGMIHWLTITQIIPATPSNPSIPCVKRTSKIFPHQNPPTSTTSICKNDPKKRGQPFAAG